MSVTSVNGKTGEVSLDAESVGAIPESALGQPDGAATLDSTGALATGQVPSSVASKAEVSTAVKVETERAEAAEALKIPLTQKGKANGVAELNSEGMLPEAELPVSVVSSSRTTMIYVANSFGVSPTKTSAENGTAMEALEAFLTTEGNVTVVFPLGVKSNKGLVVKSANVTLCGGSIELSNTGIGIKSTAEGFTIEGMRISGAGITTGVRCEGTNAKVLNNVITGISSTGTTEGEGVAIHVSGDDTRIEGNRVFSNGGEHNYNQMAGIKAAGVSGTSGRRITIINNRCYLNSTHGIYASGCDNLRIDGNLSYENGEQASKASAFGRGCTIGTAAALNPTIVNNYFFSNWENGLLLGGGGSGSEGSPVTNAVVTGNHAYKNNKGGFAGGHGLEIDCVGSYVAGNVCYENHNGISVNGILATVVGNHCFLNQQVSTEKTEQGCGIKCFFFTGSTEVCDWVLVGNHCYQNQNSGILVKGETNYRGPTVIGNRLYDNGTGSENTGNSYDLLVDKRAQSGHYEGNFTKSSSFNVRIEDENPWIRANSSGSGSSPIKSREVKAKETVALSGEGWEILKLHITTTEEVTVKVPEVGQPGRRIEIVIENFSGGSLKLTWEAGYKMATFTAPANEKRKSITFVYEGGEWVEPGHEH